MKPPARKTPDDGPVDRFGHAENEEQAIDHADEHRETPGEQTVAFRPIRDADLSGTGSGGDDQPAVSGPARAGWDSGDTWDGFTVRPSAPAGSAVSPGRDDDDRWDAFAPKDAHASDTPGGGAPERMPDRMSDRASRPRIGDRTAWATPEWDAFANRQPRRTPPLGGDAASGAGERPRAPRPGVPTHDSPAQDPFVRDASARRLPAERTPADAPERENTRGEPGERAEPSLWDAIARDTPASEASEHADAGRRAPAEGTSLWDRPVHDGSGDESAPEETSLWDVPAKGSAQRVEGPARDGLGRAAEEAETSVWERPERAAPAGEAPERKASVWDAPSLRERPEEPAQWDAFTPRSTSGSLPDGAGTSGAAASPDPADVVIAGFAAVAKDVPGWDAFSAPTPPRTAGDRGADEAPGDSDEPRTSGETTDDAAPARPEVATTPAPDDAAEPGHDGALAQDEAAEPGHGGAFVQDEAAGPASETGFAPADGEVAEPAHGEVVEPGHGGAFVQDEAAELAHEGGSAPAHDETAAWSVDGETVAGPAPGEMPEGAQRGPDDVLDVPADTGHDESASDDAPFDDGGLSGESASPRAPEGTEDVADPHEIDGSRGIDGGQDDEHPWLTEDRLEAESGIAARDTESPEATEAAEEPAAIPGPLPGTGRTTHTEQSPHAGEIEDGGLTEWGQRSAYAGETENDADAAQGPSAEAADDVAGDVQSVTSADGVTGDGEYGTEGAESRLYSDDVIGDGESVTSADGLPGATGSGAEVAEDEPHADDVADDGVSGTGVDGENGDGGRATGVGDATDDASDATGGSNGDVADEVEEDPVARVRAVPIPDPVSAALTESLAQLRLAVEDLHFGLDVPGAEEARKAQASVLAQLEDYVIPRVHMSTAPALIVVAGSTGAGKSTLVNTLAAQRVSATGVRRPTTGTPVLVCHPDDHEWFAEGDLLGGLTRLERPAKGAGVDSIVLSTTERLPPGVALLDTPDIDSVVEEHHEIAHRMLDAADLWVFVTTASRYADAPSWNLLRLAKERGARLVIVLSRVPEKSRDVIVKHFGRMLDEYGLADAERFVIKETTVADGRLPDKEVTDLRMWLAHLSVDDERRAAAIRTTLNGVLDSFRHRLPALARHLETQVALRADLRSDVDAAYMGALADIDEATRNGSLLRGEVLARWQDFAGSGDLIRTLQLRRGGKGGQRGPQRLRALRTAIRNALESMINSAAQRAAEEVVARWKQRAGAGDRLATTPGLGRSSDEAVQRTSRAIGAWQDHVTELIRTEGVTKRSVARLVSFDVESLALIFTVGLLGYGATDVSSGPGAGALPQRLLRALLGAESLRNISAKARSDLRARIGMVFDEETLRYVDTLDGAGIPDEAAATRLYQATYNLEVAR
ncbi:GTPase [Microtetraspora niveoalba]|uniref:GTPase n=1 Tax=Microtetraspora niveoalba TaxID=46175 RepID=UPI000A449F04|nr:GTPase [Microtetraspora niveoalba]